MGSDYEHGGVKGGRYFFRENKGTALVRPATVASLGADLEAEINAAGDANLFGFSVYGRINVGGNLNAASAGPLWLDLDNVGGAADLRSTGPMILRQALGRTGGDVRLVSYGGILGEVTAGDDLNVWSLGTIDAVLAATDCVQSVTTYGSLLGTVAAGIDADPDSDDTEADGYGNINHVAVWNHLVGALTAYGAVEEVYVGLDDALTIEDHVVGTLLLAAGYDRSPFVAYPRIPTPKVGSFLSATATARQTLMNLLTDFQLAEASLGKAIQAIRADAQQRLADAQEALAHMEAAANGTLNDIGNQVALAKIKADLKHARAIQKLANDLEAARLEAHDSAAAIESQIDDRREVAEGELDGRLKHDTEDKEFMREEAQTARASFVKTKEAALDQMKKLKDAAPHLFPAELLDAYKDFGLDYVQDTLEMIGTVGDFIPVIGWYIAPAADVVNSAIYAARGNRMEAGINLFCAIPFVSIAKRAGVTDAAGRFGRLALRNADKGIDVASRLVRMPAAGRAAKRMLCPAKILVGMPGCFVGDTEVLIYPAASDSTVIAGLQVSPEHASAHSNALWGSVCLVAGLGIATALVDDQRRRREAREQQEALDALFGGTDLLDDVEDDGEEPEPGTPRRNSVTSSNRDKPFQRHNHLSHAAFKTGCDRVFSQGDGEWMDRNASAAECIDPMGGSFPTNENDQDHPLWHKTCKTQSSPSPSRKATVAVVDSTCPKATIRGVPSCASVRTMVHTPSVRKRNLPAAQTRRGWLWAAVAGLLVLLGGGLLFRQASESSAPAPSTAVSASPALDSAPTNPTQKYVTKQIRDFHGFEWVLARNPEVTNSKRLELDEVDHRQWRWIELELTKPDGSVLKAGLGRPLAWLAANQIEPGTTTWLDLPEMGAVGYATVVSVAPCPDPGPKPHPDCRLVTGVFRHSSADCVNVHVAGLDTPIGSTRNHRFWSEDRQAFVAAGELHVGETLLTADGTPTSILSVAERPGSEPVYNLEVDVAHVYYVSADGVLVHNTCAVSWTTGRRTFWKQLASREISNPTRKFSARNIRRMLEGKAPLMRVVMQHRKTRRVITRSIPLELHHRSLAQRSGSAMAHEAWNLQPASRWAHEAMDEFRHAGWDLVKILNGPNSF